MSEVTITDEKLLMLDALTYYQEFSDMEKQTDGTYSTVSNFINNCHQYNTCIHEALQDYTDEDLKMDKIVNWLKEDETSKKLVIVYPNWKDKSTSSVCLVNPETAEVYVIYGGNYAEGDYSFYDRDGKIIRTNTWYDNVKGAVQADTNEQKKAMMFYEDAVLAARDYLTQEAVFKDNTGNVRDFNAKDSDGKYIENLNITVSGHSAGGNLAQYVTTTYQKYINDQSVAHPERGKYDENNDIDRCVTFDNQGFSANFINKYNTEISDRAGKITEYIPTVSYVGSLMHDLDGIEKKYIDVGTPEPYLIGYHMPAQMFDARGEFKREGKPDIIYYMMKRLSTKVMDSVSGDSSINIDEAASVMVEAIFEFMKAKNMQEGVEKAIDIISENKAASKISELIIYETIVVLEIDATYYVMVDKKNNVEEIVNLIQEGSMKDALKKSAKSLYQITLERLAQQALLPVMGSDNLGYVLGEFIFDWGAEICSNAADKIEDIVAKCGKAVDQFFDDLFSDDEEVIRLFPIYKGTEQNDTITTGKIGGLIIGDTGDDTLTGSSKADTYSFRPGDGHDVINNHDQVNWSKDVILFSEGIVQEDIEVTRNAYDMVFTNLVTGDSIIVKNAYTDMDGWNYIGKVKFFDESQWGLEELREKTRMLKGTIGDDTIQGNGWGFNYDQSEYINTYAGSDTIYAGNGDDVIDAGIGDDTIYAENGDDILIGGKGNDILTGGNGADTYLFNIGDGEDMIKNYDQENWSADKIVFENGILKDDITVTRNGADMVLTNQKSGDKVTVQNAYHNEKGWNYLGRIKFSDATMWGMKELKEKTKVLNGTEEDDVIEGNPWGYNYDQSEIISAYGGNDVIRAGEGDDRIDAGAGNDMVYGEYGSDTIVGGAGNDTLAGGYGADTYIFGVGDGQDIINNYDQERWLQDKIVFEEGILPEDIRVTRSGANMVLSNEKTGDSVTVQNAYNDSRGWNYLGKIQFSDGTMWKMDDLKEKTKVLTGTAGNDVLEGNGWGYNYDQSELISTYGGNDIIRAGVGDDVIDAGEGDDTVQGDAGNDIIIGGKGNDFLVGGSGVDTYFFGVGDGQDTINNYDQENWSQDAIVFEDGVLPEDIRISRSGSNMVLTNDRTGDRVTVQNAYNDSRGWNYLGWIEFSDRSMWGMEILKEKTKVLNGTEEADVIEGNPWGYNYDQSEIISTYGGNDVIRAGEGDDSIDAGTGNDTVYGENGNDTIIGETGNDTLMGGYGADTYIFGEGDGQDIINNYDQANWSEDKIVFLEGILPDDITVTRSGANMVLTNQKSGDKITIQNAYNDSRGWNYLGRIEFSDGTVWGMGELKEKSKVLNGTEEADVIEGNPWGYNYDQSEIISTYGGNDVIRAGEGDDSIDAGTGNDTVYGENGNDTIIGGTGNDTLMGGYGADTYIFGEGDGQDIINNYDQANWSEDKIVFLEGVLPDDITVARGGANMVLTNHKSGDRITIQNAYNDARGWNYLVRIEFSDGTVWGMGELKEKAKVLNGTEGNDVIEGNPWGYNYDQSEIISTYGGNDVIRAGAGDDRINAGTGNDMVYGESGNDTITGGTGNDSLMGGYGADTYIFGMGDGQDTINNYDQTNWSEDKIVFLEGILPDDITVTRSGADMVLTNHNSGDKITIQNAYNDSRGWNYLGRIEFSDGTVWGMGELNEKTRILTGTTGNDVINGNEAGYNYNQSEILNGGAGNDTLNGGAGDDIYLFNAHFGCDTINDGNGSNTISFGEGISAEMLDIFRTGNNLEISVTDTTDKVTINNYFTNDNFKNFTYQFFDGDILTGSDIDDIMNGTYLYHSTLQQAELFSDMMSVSETETAGYGNTEAASASMPMGEHEQLWLAS